MKFASKLQDILIDLHEITGIQSNLEGLLHMNANINKDITNRDRQILASYNNQGGMNPHQQAANGTNLTNALNYPNQHYLKLIM